MKNELKMTFLFTLLSDIVYYSCFNNLAYRKFKDYRLVLYHSLFCLIGSILCSCFLVLKMYYLINLKLTSTNRKAVPNPEKRAYFYGVQDIRTAAATAIPDIPLVGQKTLFDCFVRRAVTCPMVVTCFCCGSLVY